MTSTNFYDKVAKKFGGYAYGRNKPKYVSEYPSGNPEEIFKKELLEITKPSSIGLDIGCGDGKFTFEVSIHFSQVQGVDNSKELLSIAEIQKKNLNIKSVE